MSTVDMHWICMQDTADILAILYQVMHMKLTSPTACPWVDTGQVWVWDMWEHKYLVAAPQATVAHHVCTSLGYQLLPGRQTEGSSLSLNSIRNIDNILIIDARLHLSKCLWESCQEKCLRRLHMRHACAHVWVHAPHCVSPLLLTPLPPPSLVIDHWINPFYLITQDVFWELGQAAVGLYLGHRIFPSGHSFPLCYPTYKFVN